MVSGKIALDNEIVLLVVEPMGLIPSFLLTSYSMSSASSHRTIGVLGKTMRAIL